MCLENWDDTSAVTYDRQTWSELCSLRFIDGGHWPTERYSHRPASPSGGPVRVDAIGRR
jgi:hypothetical protein